MKYLLLLSLLLSSSLTFAQDIFQKNLYSADRILENREKLSLTDAQAEKIKKIHTDNAANFSTMKWDLDAATARLKSMLEETKIDPAIVNKQMDEVLRLESLIKKKQLNTLVAIKNELTSPQQKMLEYNGLLGIEGTRIYGNVNSAPLISSGYKVGSPLAATVVGGSNSSSPDVKLYIDNGNPNSTPLYILSTPDGEKELQGFESIKPDDIESINVLKDKSAIVKYGEKGKNGVIIITLKKDKK